MEWSGSRATGGNAQLLHRREASWTRAAARAPERQRSFNAGSL